MKRWGTGKNMKNGLRKAGCSIIASMMILAVMEGIDFVRWLVFGGSKPLLFDWKAGLCILAALWIMPKVGDWFERREKRFQDMAARIRDIDARMEALYKWGNIPSDDEEEVRERLLEDDEDLDEGTKANIAKYKADAVQGDAWQQNNLAIAYSNLHTTSGYKKAVYWFHKAQEQGQDSEHSLAETYCHLHDYNNAMLWYRKAVQRGGSLVYLAEDDIGDMYAEGQGVSQNHAEAARWWSRAAKQGWKSSHYALGKLYAEGAEGVEQNTSEAYFHLYIASSAKNYPNPYATELRDEVAKKLGEYAVAREQKRAEESLTAKKEIAGQNHRKTSDNEIGDNVRNIHTRFADMDIGIADRVRNMDTRIEALYKWGGLRFLGDAEQDNDDCDSDLDDETKAKIAEYREGINSGDSTSHYSLGVLFWNRAMSYYNSHTKDGYRDAIRWLRKAASVDYDCENTLGDAFIELQEYDEAMYWYRRSVERGGSLVGIAESDIADMYAEGQGVSVNHAEAAWWWNRAAQHGRDWSHYKLGKLYAEGADGVAKDNRKALFHLYIASSDSGSHSPQKSAIELCKEVEKELGEYSISQEKQRADEWLAAHKENVRQETKNKIKPLPLPD